MNNIPDIIVSINRTTKPVYTKIKVIKNHYRKSKQENRKQKITNILNEKY